MNTGEIPMLEDYLDDLARAGTPQAKIILAIYNDISDRRGVGDELGAIDDNIVVDMLKSWVLFAVETLGTTR